ncbi:MAG: response regulator [Hyphomicrobiales bacterium]|nr:response regulator [Hyphomicrobiales bacterium]MBV9906343.1 response regulator [Hyphomicrobiales bacterium]
MTTPTESADVREAIRAAQIDALFRAGPLGVASAAVASVVLLAILRRLGSVDAGIGSAWSAFVVICALSHILLGRAYWRSRAHSDEWRKWALWFSVISFAEGMAWGWAPIGLAIGDRFEVELVVVVVTAAVAEGAIVAFGSYLPAFYALFFPATLPYALASAASSNPVERLTSLLMLVFIAAFAALGFTTNRSFKQIVGLRIRTQAMALDLQKQKDIAEREREIAVEANRAKSSFLAAASHDLRQPIHALGMFVGALRAVPMAPEGRRIIQQIEASTAAMDGLFSALLDISKLDAGVVAVERRAFAIGPVLERLCQDHQEEAKAKGVSLVWKRCSAIVWSDPVLIERVLRNLVSNAARYTDRGRIVIGARRRGATIAVQVIDTGRGIPLDEQKRVFQEYYQLGNPHRDSTKGLGLGLAIVRRLTSLLDCGLTLRSEAGRGSRFEVTIPLAEHQSPVAEPEPAVGSLAPAKGLVIVIDDEPAVRDATLGLLTGWGYKVVAVEGGDEAILRLSADPAKPALILCDYRLRDGESGLVVIERIRAKYNELIPAILITGDTAPDRLTEAKASGLLLMHKPVSNLKLRAAIGNLILSARPSRPVEAGLSAAE